MEHHENGNCSRFEKPLHQPVELAKRGRRNCYSATALLLGAAEFLTFDADQKKLAKSEGLKVPL